MPTSSQALIWFNCGDNVKDKELIGARRSSSYVSLRDPARMSVASVYNINGFYSIPATQVKNGDALSFLGKAGAQLFKFTELPKGFRSILSYDPLTQSFCWRILGGQEVNLETRDDEEILDEPTPYFHRDDMLTTRPVTALARKKKHTIDQDLYDRLINLGFRASGFEIREGSKSTTSPKSATTVTIHKHLIKKKPLVVRKTASEPHRVEQGVRKTEERKVASPIASDGEDADDESTSVDEDLDPDGFYRILPSVCMRTDMPLPRPKAAVFSFRDNEERCHKEVMDIIKEQTNLKVIGLQLDPVNVRATKPGLRSRWIVEFGCVIDLELFVRKGLKLGKDKMIVYKFDDVARREFSTFKYYKTIQDAKKTLKGTKSEKQTGKPKKVVRLREANSNTVKTTSSFSKTASRKRSYDK